MAADRDKIKILIKCIIAVVLVYILLASGKLEFSKIRELFSADISWLLWPFILLSVSQIIVSLRLSYIINSQGGELTVWKAFKMNMIGLFFNNYLPGSLGGDITKGYYICKDIPNGLNFMGTVLLDRFLGFLGLMLIAIVSQAVMFSQIRFHYKNNVWLVLFWMVIFAGICSLAIFYAFIKSSHDNDYIKRKLSASAWGKKVIAVIKGLLAITMTKKQVLYLIILSVAAHSASILAIFIIGAKLACASYKSICLIPVILFAGVLPVTPGGLGWTEYFSEWTYSAFNLTQGANIFLIWRIITVVFSLSGLIFYVFKINKNASSQGAGGI